MRAVASESDRPCFLQRPLIVGRDIWDMRTEREADEDDGREAAVEHDDARLEFV
jgi:hypothetical protein